MATTATLVYADANKLRYLVAYSGSGGTSVNITDTGAATPDLITDTLQGPLKKLAKVVADGFGAFAAGAQTQAKARALWLSNWAGADPAPGDPAGVSSLLTTAICRFVRHISAGDLLWGVDANVSGADPILTVSMISSAGVGTASSIYLDIEVPQAIG